MTLGGLRPAPQPPRLARGRAIVSFPPPTKSFESRLQRKSTASNKLVISCLVMFQIPNQVRVDEQPVIRLKGRDLRLQHIVHRSGRLATRQQQRL